MSKARVNARKKAIDKIMIPLMEVGINYFTYCIYSDDRAEIITNNRMAVTTFLNDKGSKLPIEIQSPRMILQWNEYCSDYYIEFLEKHYNVDIDGITLVLKHANNKAEHISIASTCGDVRSTIDKIHSSKQILKNIVSHIRNQVNFNKDKFMPISFAIDIKSQSASEGDNQEKLIGLHNREYLYGINGPTYITRAEKKCFLLLLQMKTSREIAEDIDTTARTVECHIANLRKKLGANSRHDLFRIARNNFISTIE